MSTKKFKLDATANLCLELRRMKSRVEERLAQSVRNDTKARYGEAMQTVCSVIDFMIECVELDVPAVITASRLQPMFPGWDDGEQVDLPFGKYDNDDAYATE